MSEKDDVSNGSVSAKEVLRELTRERDAAEQPTYTPPHKQISGKLDLRHRTVKVAVEMQGCEFLDEVDLRYCEFEQTVNFSGCKFWKHLNSGDNVESHTVYRKDFNCSEAVFEGPFDLNGGRIEGSAYFSGTKFQHKGQSANFAWTSIEETLEFEGAIFEGPASFASLKCKGDLFCQDTIFKGGADFASLKCGGDGRFDRASFGGEEGVDFSEASLGVDLYCPDASFQGPANFRSLKCSNLTCNRVTFGGSATFSSVECSDSGHFRNVTFEEETNFAYASFGSNLYCQDTTFKGQVTFYQTTIGTLVLGDSSPFAQKSLDLRECTFERFNGGLLQAKHLTGAQKPAVFSRDPYLQLEKYYQSTENEPDAKEIGLTQEPSERWDS